MNKVKVGYFDGRVREKILDLGTSKQVAEQIKAEPLMCWHNNINAFELFEDGFYVEGWAVYTGKEQTLAYWEHSWLEINGEIIDTLPDNDWEWKDERTVYFPGVKYSKKLVSTLEIEVPFVKAVRRPPKGYAMAEERACNYFMTVHHSYFTGEIAPSKKRKKRYAKLARAYRTSR